MREPGKPRQLHPPALTVHEDRGAPPGDVVGALAALLLERAKRKLRGEAGAAAARGPKGGKAKG